MAGTLHRSRESRTGRALRRLVLVGTVVVGVVLGGCGTSDDSSRSSTSESKGAATSGPSTTLSDHQKHLVAGETISVTAQLVPVPGYRYEDVPKAEVEAALKQLREFEKSNGAAAGEIYSAVSLHSVVAEDPAQNTARAGDSNEVGFLRLVESAQQLPVGIEEEVAKGFSGGVNQIDTLTVSEIPVYVFEDPASTDSRYYYVWIRDGVLGAVDGATRPELERWLTAYLAEPVLLPNETGRLSAALVPVSGYVYANDTDGFLTSSWITKPLGEVPNSFHLVADTEGTMGELLLAEVEPSMTTQQLTSTLLASVGDEFTSVGTSQMGGVTVEHLTGPDDVFAWTRDGIAGIYLTTENVDKAEPFLTTFLSTPPGPTG